MPVLETMTFRLLAASDEDAFLAADRRVQTAFAYQQAGLVRRTTARAPSGDWMVVDLWRSDAEADDCAERWRDDPVANAFMAFVDHATVRIRRYATLD